MAMVGEADGDHRIVARTDDGDADVDERIRAWAAFERQQIGLRDNVADQLGDVADLLRADRQRADILIGHLRFADGDSHNFGGLVETVPNFGNRRRQFVGRHRRDLTLVEASFEVCTALSARCDVLPNALNKVEPREHGPGIRLIAYCAMTVGGDAREDGCGQARNDPASPGRREDGQCAETARKSGEPDHCDQP
jgi:hypothetical protein